MALSSFLFGPSVTFIYEATGRACFILGKRMSDQKISFSTLCTQSDFRAALYRLAFIPFLHDFSLRNALIATCLNTPKFSEACPA